MMTDLQKQTSSIFNRSLNCSRNSFFLSFLIWICIFSTTSSGQYTPQHRPDFEETGAIEGVECISNGKFYRNPEFKDGVRGCAKYYWCPRGKVLEFRCSAGLWFDVDRQICDFKSKIRNCEKSHGKSIHRQVLTHSNMLLTCLLLMMNLLLKL